MAVSQTAGRVLPFQTLRAQAAAQPFVVDTLLALALSGLSIFTLLAGAQDLGQVDPLNLTLLLLQTVPLAVRRRWPVAVFLITFGALIVQVLVIQNAFSAPLGSFIALYTVGQRVDRTRSGLLAAGAALVFLLVMIEKGALPAGIAGVIQSELALFVVWTLGVWSRERQAYVGEVEERAATARARARGTRRAGRRRGARTDRARAPRRRHPSRERHRHPGGRGAARPRSSAGGGADGRRGDRLDRLARRWPTCAGCSASWRRRLAVEGIVGAGDTTTDPLAPMPGLRPARRAARAGPRDRPAGRADGRGRAPRRLDPGIELSAYRIIQEALTNTLKHARGATAQVRVRYRHAELEIEVTDRGGSGGRGIGVPGESRSRPDRDARAGRRLRRPVRGRAGARRVPGVGAACRSDPAPPPPRRSGPDDADPRPARRRPAAGPDGLPDDPR